MKMLTLTKKVIAIIAIMCGEMFPQNTPLVVTNVDFTMRNDGSRMVDITYDVFDAQGQTMTVTIAASSDGGVTWNLPITQVTGAVGSGITNGTGKTIVWNAGAEIPNYYSATVQIRISADDGYVFVCGTGKVNYAGKIYNTVQIGNQCWLKENLDVGTMIQVNQNATNNGIIEKYCYNNDANNCNTYGGYYEWNEAMQYETTPGTQGICPPGWHVPTYTEMQTLQSAVGNDGNALKAVGQGWGGGVGTNTSGFSALLAGFLDYDGYFSGSGAFFWISLEYDATKARYLILYADTSQLYVFFIKDKNSGLNVRCVHD